MYVQLSYTEGGALWAYRVTLNTTFYTHTKINTHKEQEINLICTASQLVMSPPIALSSITFTMPVTLTTLQWRGTDQEGWRSTERRWGKVRRNIRAKPELNLVDKDIMSKFLHTTLTGCHHVPSVAFAILQRIERAKEDECNKINK